MKMTLRFLITVLMCIPVTAFGNVDKATLDAIRNADTIEDAKSKADKALELVEKKYSKANNKNQIVDAKNKISSSASSATTPSSETASASQEEIHPEEHHKAENTEPAEEEIPGNQEQGTKDSTDVNTSLNNLANTTGTLDNAKSKLDDATSKLDDAKDKLQEAKDKENSWENRLLTGLTTAATGIGGMELAQGIAQNAADKAADKDMEAYMKTMYCKYGEIHTVPFGTEDVFLPFDSNVDQMRGDYIELANALKTRKEQLGLKPGIESEEILSGDGLYDDENTGVTGGHYDSRYRAAAGSADDKKGLDNSKKEARNRMIAGGVIAGAGIVAGAVGNYFINTKPEKEKNETAIETIKDKMKDAGIEDVSDLKLDSANLDLRDLADKIDDVEFDSDKVNGKKAKNLFSTSGTKSFIRSIRKNLKESDKSKLDSLL